jgi:methanogenic corrinoid protein MtbC1
MGAMAETAICREISLLRRTYLDLLLAGQRHKAMQAVLSQVEAGLPVDTVYIDVLQPVLYELGRLWQINEIDVATEHYVTAVTQLLMARLFPYALNQKRVSRSMIGCCLGSELHELGMRMVCDFFEFKGWNTYFLGAITPQESLLGAIRSRRPDLLCLSATMAFGLPQIRDLIKRIQDSSTDTVPKIMVGGLPFIISPGLSAIVGADATAPDARLAVQVADKLFEPGAHNATSN